MTATERAQLPAEELAAIQGQELSAVTTAYVVLGLADVGASACYPVYQDAEPQ